MNKPSAESFLQLAASGRVREAFANHAAPNFRHHNAWFRSDAASLAAGMEENAAKNPQKTCEIKRAIEDGDFVMLMSHVRMNPQDRGVAVVHIFRFENGRIAELWDLGQPVPEKVVNELGMF